MAWSPGPYHVLRNNFRVRVRGGGSKGDTGAVQPLTGDDLHDDMRTQPALLAGVGSLVPGNGALVSEAHWAHRASVGLLPGVRPLVPGNVALLAEAP